MGRPKALLDLEGETFLDRLISRFTGICDPIIVVLGYDSARVRDGIRSDSVATFAINPAPQRGMLSSLQCGLRELPAGAAAILFTLVDLPAVERSTIQAVAAAKAPVVIPRFDARNGHPVQISRAIAAELLALPVEAQARDVLHRHRAATLFIDVADPAILNDVDTPQEYDDLIAGARR